MAPAAADPNVERRGAYRSAGFGGKSRTGLGAELLLSLLIVMLTSTALIGAMLVRTHEDSIRRLHRLITRALVEELRSPLALFETEPGDLRWWIVGRDGAVTPRGNHDFEVDADSLALARAVRDRGLLTAGAPWDPIRFAAPLDQRGDVALAVLPAVVPRGLVLVLLFGNAEVFTLLGGTCCAGGWCCRWNGWRPRPTRSGTGRAACAPRSGGAVRLPRWAAPSTR
jgi:hypothetical protein